MGEDLPVVRVSLEKIYETQQETLVTLAEIKGTLALQSQQDRNDASTLVDHESRIRKLESKIYALPGAATLISAGSLLYMLLNGR